LDVGFENSMIVADGCGVKGVVLELQILCVCLKKLHVIRNVGPCKPCTRCLQHLLIDIAEDDRSLRPDPFADEDCQVACARSNIEHLGPRLDVARVDCVPLDDAVSPE
jgi:hypothetical protein